MRKFLSLLLALLMLPLPGALAAEKYETLPEHMQMTQFGDSPSYSFAISLIQQ